MNVFFLTFRLIFLLLWTFATVNAAAQATFFAKSIEQKLPALEEELKDYQIISLDSRALLEGIQKKPDYPVLSLEFGTDQRWELHLQTEEIRGNAFQIQVLSEKGVRKQEASLIKAFSGQVKGSEAGTCRITLAEGFIYGIFELNDATWFIEPAKRFGRSAGFDTYILYKAEDVLPNPGGHCAAIELAHFEAKPQLEKSSGTCYTLEIALAADYQMLQLSGSIEELENYVLGILNLVHTNYDDEFNHTIRFKATGLYVSTCDTCDPWEPVTNYLQVLSEFRNWGNAGGFNGIPYDLACLWTGRAIDNNIVGGGYYGSVCSNQRYQVLRRYTPNLAITRTLQAHELGHNFNALHDPNGTSYIMSPIIRNHSEWSTVSKNAIHSYLNTALTIPDCFEGCDPIPAPVAAFSADVTSGCAPLTVQFTNQSLGTANSWEWTFAGSDTLVTLLKNPQVTFSEAGTYRVQLVASNPIGSDTLRQEAYIIVKNKPEANFAVSTTLGSSIVSFTNAMSNAENWLWNFGDGNSSTERNPTHSYSKDGTYEVRLIAWNDCSADTIMQIVNIITAPSAGFSASVTTGCVPLIIDYVNQSSENASSFEWQFPGGVPAFSSERNPRIIYSQPGIYKVSLVARNAAGNAMVTKNGFITVKSKPVANYSFTQTENEVNFFNESLYATTYRWSFGDGRHSELQNPVHAFENPGNYNVKLTVINECGSDTLLQTVNVSGIAPTANFMSDIQSGCAPVTMQFTDLSNGTPTARRWYFPGGEPAYSEDKNPQVIYSKRGTYPVKLTAANFWGADSLVLEDYIFVEALPEPAFTYEVNGLEVEFLPEIINPNWQYTWDFGEGETVNQAIARHIYQTSGNYPVKLTVMNECGTATIQQTVALMTTAVTYPAFLTQVQLSPNPGDGNFQLNLAGAPQLFLMLRVSNAFGQFLLQKEIDFSVGRCSVALDWSHLPAGMYWLEIRGEAGTMIRPIVIQKH